MQSARHRTRLPVCLSAGLVYPNKTATSKRRAVSSRVVLAH
ncbi:hypothetical protein ACFODT_11585 [Vibrio zhugei]|uniref:Uncharacterized protein n=1 Tax=Vibrio zhugei TaxID=2479546 RepID=A0ABV7CD35_9VIBR